MAKETSRDNVDTGKDGANNIDQPVLGRSDVFDQQRRETVPPSTFQPQSKPTSERPLHHETLERNERYGPVKPPSSSEDPPLCRAAAIGNRDRGRCRECVEEDRLRKLKLFNGRKDYGNDAVPTVWPKPPPSPTPEAAAAVSKCVQEDRRRKLELSKRGNSYN